MKALTLALTLVISTVGIVSAKPAKEADCKKTQAGVMELLEKEKLPSITFSKPEEIKRINKELGEIEKDLSLESETDTVLLAITSTEAGTIQEILKGCVIVGGIIPLQILERLFNAGKGKVGQGI